MNTRLVTIPTMAVLALATLTACGSSSDDAQQGNTADQTPSTTQSTTQVQPSGQNGGSGAQQGTTFLDGTVESIKPYDPNSLVGTQCEGTDPSADTPMTPCPTADGKVLGTILLDVPTGSDGAPKGQYVITITADTDLSMAGRKATMTFDDLQPGVSVRAHVGVIMQSNPAQTTATQLDVLMR